MGDCLCVRRGDALLCSFEIKKSLSKLKGFFMMEKEKLNS